MGPIKRGQYGKLGALCTVSNFCRKMHQAAKGVNHCESEAIITRITVLPWPSAGLDQPGLINTTSSTLSWETIHSAFKTTAPDARAVSYDFL